MMNLLHANSLAGKNKSCTNNTVFFLFIYPSFFACNFILVKTKLYHTCTSTETDVIETDFFSSLNFEFTIKEIFG
jgi:hypothetical protein